MEWLKKWLPSIIFNIAETLIILLLGIMIGVHGEHILFVLAAFLLTRLIAKNPKHYKKWQQCLIWSSLIFLTLFVVAKANVAVSVLLSIFGAMILSGIADIGDMYMWKPKGEWKYQKEIEFVKYNPICPDLLAFESRLKSDNDNLTYMCYHYIFKQGMSWDKTAQELNTESKRLTPIVDKIAFGLRISCKI